MRLTTLTPSEKININEVALTAYRGYISYLYKNYYRKTHGNILQRTETVSTSQLWQV